jgi:hypothetical protein
VPAKSGKVFFSLFAMKVSATGTIVPLIGTAVSILILAVAWRIASLG